MDKRGIGPLLSFIAEGVILFNQRGEVTLVNPHASLLLDQTESSMIGKDVDGIIGAVLCPHEKTTLGYRIADRVFTTETALHIPQGQDWYFESSSGSCFPVFAAARRIVLNGEEQGVLIFRDISVEKKLERYKVDTAKRLSQLIPIMQKVATGTFDVSVPLPEIEDELTEVMVGLQLMIDDLATFEVERERSLVEQKNELESIARQKTTELENAKHHIEIILENLWSGLIEYDSNFIVVRMNAAAERILGVKRGDVMGKKITPEDKDIPELESLALISYPVLAASGKRVVKDAHGKNTAVHEINVTRPLEQDIEITTIPLTDTSGRASRGFIKVIRDITREKNINRSKTEFISIAAHQLRTPLSAIKWVLQLIIDEDVGAITDEQKELLQKGFDTNEKMISLVNDLLNVARIEEGRFDYVFESGNILSLTDRLIDELRVVAEEAGVKLEYEKPESVESFVFDAARLELSIQNLISNAIKYTPQGGTVRVVVSLEGTNLSITVSDTGVGIPERQLDRLFTKFFRAENVIKMQVTGTGLGLFIVKNIVARHGGTITVQSKENEGSTFTLTIPTNREAGTESEDISQS